MKFFQFFLLAEANPQMHAENSANAGGKPKRSEITRTIGTDILESETGTSLLFPVLT